jgi:NifU-like protein involved in Fe-S cluster formation
MSASADNPYGYGAEIWRLFREAPRAGRFDPATPGLVVGEAGTPAASGRLRLELLLRDGRVADARFQAYGCPTTIATAAFVAATVVGRTVDELGGITAAWLRAQLEIPDARAHCVLMGEDLVRAAITHIQDHAT